jgi:drug/metabolite transporter (DMT)-like permease
LSLKVYQHIITHVIDACLLVGVLLIVKGYGTEFGWWNPDKSSYWTRANEWLDAVIALVSTCLIAASIYLEKRLRTHPRPPNWISYYFLAPGVVVSGLGSLIWMIYVHRVNGDIVNGYAILGLLGGINRLLPFSEGPPYPPSRLD